MAILRAATHEYTVRPAEGDAKGDVLGLQSQHELENTRKKLRLIEEHYERKRKEPADDDHVRDLTLQSLKKMINQLKEEITRYEAHAAQPAKSER